MNQNDANHVSKSLSLQQRRTQSVDEHSLKRLDGEVFGENGQRMNKGISDGSCDIIEECSDIYGCNVPTRNADKLPSGVRSRAFRRSRSCFAPSPHCSFGPKATLKKIQNNNQLIVIQDPSSQRLHWLCPPKYVLIIRKPGQSTVPEFRTLVLNLLKRDLTVYIDSSDETYLPFDKNETDKEKVTERCKIFDEEHDISVIDLAICLGGDGTLLHASSIFQQTCPPILSFSLGSLGFLTPFDFKYHDKILNEVLSGNVALLLRTRLSCVIQKDTPDTSKVYSGENGTTTEHNDHGNTYLVLNEVVIDRGPNSYLSNLDLYINDKFITKVQGDGLIISTPTGSTAYGMAAGASMVHPNVPAMVICPICPHSLSFRPIVVPAGLELEVKVSEDTRLTAWLSVDGRNRLELQQQDSVRITTSVYPIPSISRFDQLGDWFESLANILHWNLRKPQSSLDTDQDLQLQDDESNEFVPTS
ncbi:unnamed protein product [Adineta ricciae]|uniref:NAD(+) kinase n=1 Tax=Adineta ricciae TaxID=249248 RepID=A0A815F4S7_ADIRI|nr:unnamed protein product [Adineta ricciae]CAF1320674.1 unnamed protein product [Adineta ricciae]